ncbi:hypothetical protein [Gimesia fumaroli]|uniref:Uncharacterized protein n=1 Tax=Gimesia fumaroli TaxID=2527976 RepID=A0A518I915_9PLAN|nr:hypothetical protein [Gimesia fumaroli]QDV49539.1 hypothetical protein Enr17x_15580 [Gimesia fumaroli]
MAQSPLMDMLSNALLGKSILPGVSLSGTTPANGSSFDCDNMIGSVHGLFAVGAATGSPTSFTVTCKLQESDSGSGDWTDLATQSALVLDADGEVGIIRGVRAKRYVRAVATPAFVDGTSPTAPVSAQICGQKQTVS